MHTSHAAASKLGDANCSTRLCSVTSKARVCEYDRLAMPEWVTTTPLGRPVEPEV